MFYSRQKYIYILIEKNIEDCDINKKGRVYKFGVYKIIFFK